MGIRCARPVQARTTLRYANAGIQHIVVLRRHRFRLLRCVSADLRLRFQLHAGIGRLQTRYRRIGQFFEILPMFIVKHVQSHIEGLALQWTRSIG